MIELPFIQRPPENVGSPENPDEPRERFWRSLADLQDDPHLREMQAQEFVPGANDPPRGATRRQFLQLMGASAAMAGLSACRRPSEPVLPYTRQPEEIIPGEPLYYATAMPYRGTVRPVLVESHEGRPTKIEGNPQHPMSGGATGAFEQASILNLYDPDRSGRVLRHGVEGSWAEFVRFAADLAGNSRVVVLAEPDASPTVRALRDRMGERFAGLRWVPYAAGGDDPGRIGLERVVGRAVRPLYRFSEAEVIVSLDADFLGPTAVDFVHDTAEFARSRRIETPEGDVSRLYVVESTFSLTGGMADHRKRLRAADIPALAEAMAMRLGVGDASGGLLDAGGASGGLFEDDSFLDALVEDLRRAGPRGVVVAGDTQPPGVHALVAAVNQALGAVGTSVSYLDVGEEARPARSGELAEVVADMRSGSIDLLLMLGVNPVYDAPPALGFAEAMSRVDETVHLGLHLDETGWVSGWHIPQAHYLESWGDGRACDGTLSVIQPLIAPLYEQARSGIEVLAALANGASSTGYDLVREQWSTLLPGDFESQWRTVLHDGLLPDSGYSEAPLPDLVAGLGLPGTPLAASPNGADVAHVEPNGVGVTSPEGHEADSPGRDGMEVVIRLDPTLLDGSYANNAWMMELPDPTTKIVWDNVALISPATAASLGVELRYDRGRYEVDVLEIRMDGRSVRLPAWIQPGLADDSVQLTLGYGRRIETTRPPRKARFFDLDHYTDVHADGPLANDVGANVSVLRGVDMGSVLTGAEVSVTGETRLISTTQEHGSMEGRALFRQASLDTFRKHPRFASEAVPPLGGQEPWEEYPALWESNHPSKQPSFKDSPYYDNQWGMVIDLNTCTGCNACIVACNSENNVQMVGREEVGRGREMHWLRIDRYFVSGEGEGEDDPRMVVQPVPCMHCENAPCESVCPVAATVHSPDGTNQMIYNRCIGTRYCSNNCPYKVRRFSFFNWTKTLPSTTQMAQNPDVTVRFRGVMEKCSYCIQRVREAQRSANIEERVLEDGEVLTACQQACPAGSIVFGDLNDPDSGVSRARRNPRRYEMLAELAVKPRTSYLARVTNPSPAMVPTPAAVAPTSGGRE